MSVLIKTMTNLPEHCYDCPCRDGESGYCQADKEHRYSDYRPFWCPLVKISVESEDTEMQVVVNIPNWLYNVIMECKEPHYSRSLGDAVRDGTPLPKGHGRLIDVNSVCQIVRPIEPSDSEWGMTAETAKQIIHNAFKKAPTIIEADKGESEEEE